MVGLLFHQKYFCALNDQTNLLQSIMDDQFHIYLCQTSLQYYCIQLLIEIKFDIELWEGSGSIQFKKQSSRGRINLKQDYLIFIVILKKFQLKIRNESNNPYLMVIFFIIHHQMKDFKDIINSLSIYIFLIIFYLCMLVYVYFNYYLQNRQCQCYHNCRIFKWQLSQQQAEKQQMWLSNQKIDIMFVHYRINLNIYAGQTKIQ